jgi:iron complex outermembrane receptor protein
MVGGGSRENAFLGARRAAAGAFALLLAAGSTASAQQQSGKALADFSLEELANLQITSVSRRPERISDAPASVYVITGDEIRRSGYTSLPEALRLAPNLSVARIDASQYAISARGFNNSIGNKLLVLIDGRTVYTPLFSGVFWDQQDVLLEDVERIEVISGPGATLWGANAVNGVINVITRPASATQGILTTLGGGNREQGAALRYGGTFDGGHFRVYGKTQGLENTRAGSGGGVLDGREHNQAGFRADWKGSGDQLTLQGDIYSGRTEDRGTVAGFATGRVETSGMNLLALWTRQLADGSDFRVQAYADQAKREDRVLFLPDAQIFDVEFQHNIPSGAHRLVWGAGYRHGRDNVDDALLAGLRPTHRELNWANVFVQDEIRLTDKLDFTAGIKLEHNDYTGMEYLPSARLAWKPSDNRLLWAAVSRAVRAPSRFDREITVPGFSAFFLGGPNFESEVADVFELGYRAQPSSRLSYSVTLFRHEWDRLRSGTTLPLLIQNKIEGPVYGVEAWAAWQVTQGWRLSGGLATLRKHLRLEPGSTDPVGPSNVTLANDPEFQWMLRSSLDLSPTQQLDVMVRRVGALPAPSVPEYTAVDLRYGWRVRPDLELSLAVQNLLDRWHSEFRPSNLQPNEFERAFFVKLRWAH